MKQQMYVFLFLSGLIYCLMPLNVAAQQIKQKAGGDFIESTSHNEHLLGTKRVLQYQPDGENFICVNGKNKFTRALYGTNTAFRIETSDMPEFGFFMPNMGGNLHFGFSVNGKTKWLNDAKNIRSIYRAGSRIYEIQDDLFNGGKLIMTVLAMADAEGMILKISSHKLPADFKLYSVFGGASGKRFSRNGDLGVDPPDSFSLNPDACKNNKYELANSSFLLQYARNSRGEYRETVGLFPNNSKLKLSSPYSLKSVDECWESLPNEEKPILMAEIPISTEMYIAIKVKDHDVLSDLSLPDEFDKAEKKRAQIAGTLTIRTPDSYLNPLGGVISVAADGIWDDVGGWMHGAVGWRMPLSGWRAAYVGDVIGWHERAKSHFDGFAASQITHIEPIIPHPAQDKKLNLARAEKTWGTQMYSNGYICRNPYDTTKMHHYDMNLVYIDELLWHFNWTGDMEYVKKMWPVLQRHLAWEKRNYDPDNDGLYDAYACIWASDALQYDSGGVTHASAYNYRANKMAAEIAKMIGEDSKLYEEEAALILNAINKNLWLPEYGWWAEFKDYMGEKMIHPNAAIWSVYHAIDSEIHTPFQAYQATRYVDTQIPHIPVNATGLPENEFYTISTTNWLPYSWSINNVAFAEVAHTCLAYWQAGRADEATQLFKSIVLDGMYLGKSPGNIGQVSFYDAARGECYRDFGDPVGVYSRVVVQGLFGMLPDAMNGRLRIKPGFPADWNYASIATPDVSFDFKREGNKDFYKIKSRFSVPMQVELLVAGRKERIVSLKVNGKNHAWTLDNNGVGKPLVKILCPIGENNNIEITWGGSGLEKLQYKSVVNGEKMELTSNQQIDSVYDPQQVLSKMKTNARKITGIISGKEGNRTLFVKLSQGQMKWWEPVNIEIKEPLTIEYDADKNDLELKIINNSSVDIKGELFVNSYKTPFYLAVGKTSTVIKIPDNHVVFGTNVLKIKNNGKDFYSTKLVNWNLKNSDSEYEMVQMDNTLNAKVTQIFKNEYLTPRSPYTTLQIPTQGIGEWCHPLLMADIDDSGLRNASKGNFYQTPFGIPFRTAGDTISKNIAFTSLWDNYPEKIEVPLSGRASHAYLLMAGTTNHMQCHIPNGIVKVTYTDGSIEELKLINPETWVPIEQDFYVDDSAFCLQSPRPYRVAFKTGIVSRDMQKDMGIKPTEVYGRIIDGGAGIILDLPLDKNKELKNIKLQTIANEVVIGLMAVTLLR